MRCRRAIELFRDRRDLGRERHLEVVTATTKVDDVGVVRITQDAIEEPVAQRLAVATEDLVRATTESGRRDRALALDHRRRCLAHEVKGLFAPQQLATATDVILNSRTGGGGRLTGSSRHRAGGCGCFGPGSDVTAVRVARTISFPDLSFPIAATTTASATTTPAALFAVAIA